MTYEIKGDDIIWVGGMHIIRVYVYFIEIINYLNHRRFGERVRI